MSERIEVEVWIDHQKAAVILEGGTGGYVVRVEEANKNGILCRFCLLQNF